MALAQSETDHSGHTGPCASTHKLRQSVALVRQHGMERVKVIFPSPRVFLQRVSRLSISSFVPSQTGNALYYPLFRKQPGLLQQTPRNTSQFIIAKKTSPAGASRRQADGRAGVRHHQVGDGLLAVLAARLEEGQRRVESGLPGVECETYGRIAPVGRENERNQIN